MKEIGDDCGEITTGNSMGDTARVIARAMTGSHTLRGYPAETVRLSCEKCQRAERYKKQNLIARYGADIRLPDLREESAKCERHGKMHDACMVRYVDLIPKR